jgi:hypothetical protein
VKSRPISLFPLYICLALWAASLITPPAVLALETKSAGCGGGRTVSCSAFRCVCQENIGCTGYNSDGQVVQDSPCPSRVAPIEEAPVE